MSVCVCVCICVYPCASMSIRLCLCMSVNVCVNESCTLVSLVKMNRIRTHTCCHAMTRLPRLPGALTLCMHGCLSETVVLHLSPLNCLLNDLHPQVD